MSEHEVEALAVGYEDPLGKLISAIEAALQARAEGKPLQQIFLAAPRGHGKSFLARLLQIELKRSNPDDVLIVSMPEENYGVVLPHHLLRRLTEVVSGRKKRNIPSSHFEKVAWADPEQARHMWEEELDDLWREVDYGAPRPGRLLVTNLENFDLHENLFRPGSIGRALLQELLNSPQNRLVLFGSTSRAAERSKLAKLLGDPIILERFQETPKRAALEKIDSKGTNLS